MSSLSIINDQEKKLVTLLPLEKGALVHHLIGTINHHPTKYSLQIGKDQHLDVPPGKMDNNAYPWVYLNHSCSPNCYMKNKQLFALVAIDAQTELTFNYNTTEFEMASPFSCNCDSSSCLQKIKGYKYLTKYQREKIAKFTASYLIEDFNS